jgi:hypothetical protein
MDSTQNSKELILVEDKSDNTSKNATNKTINNLTENRLSNDLNFRKGKSNIIIIMNIH